MSETSKLTNFTQFGHEALKITVRNRIEKDCLKLMYLIFFCISPNKWYNKL